MNAIACLRSFSGAPAGYRKSSTDARICQYSFADFRSEDLVKSLDS
jgi:hypothetical protein